MNVSRRISFTLNGRKVSAEIDNRASLVEVLTQTFDLRGARESCGQGLCGCCTVYVDDKPLAGCLTLAFTVDGASVTTIEGIAAPGKLDPVQEAFIEASAFQCGFCTPGFIMMTRKLLEENPDPDDDEIRHYLAGNLCRCSAYPEIMIAVKLAASKLRQAASATA